MTAIRKAYECHFHSRDDVRGYLDVAERLVDDLSIADDLRDAAFSKAVDLLAQKQVTFEEVSGAGVLLNNRLQG